MQRPEDNARMPAFPNAGKDGFEELMCARKFLKKAGPIVARQSDLYVY